MKPGQAGRVTAYMSGQGSHTLPSADMSGPLDVYPGYMFVIIEISFIEPRGVCGSTLLPPVRHSSQWPPDFLWEQCKVSWLELSGKMVEIPTQDLLWSHCPAPGVGADLEGGGGTVVRTLRSTWRPYHQITATSNLYPTHQPPVRTLSFVTSNLLHLSDHQELIRSFVADQNVLQMTRQPKWVEEKLFWNPCKLQYLLIWKYDREKVTSMWCYVWTNMKQVK